MSDFVVNFKSENRRIRVNQGTDLLAAATKAGIRLNAACGGEGLCGKCRVRIAKGEIRTELSRFITDSDRKKGLALACQSIIKSDLEVIIPKESLEVHRELSHEAEDFTKGIVFSRESAFKHLPLVQKIYLELAPPTLDDNASDLDRITRELEARFSGVAVTSRLPNIKHLSGVMRESDFKLTVVLGYKDGLLEILAIEPGDTTKNNFGFAFDIGTTTVAGQLINLNTREILGTRIAYNKQSSYGSDVISRILFASDASGLEKLSEAVIDNVNEIIEDLCGSSGVNLGDIYSVVFAGNTTMTHILLKIDPSHIRKEPYVPTTCAFPVVHTAELGIESNPKGIAACLPGVSAYIGGDIVSGILACGLSEAEELSVLIDIGTNGEIVLGNREWMIGAAASAGPAFEGSGLSSGMKAVGGAIQKIKIDKDLNVEFKTIDGSKPKGICGSGYIDLLKAMLSNAIMTKNGKIVREIKSKRVREGDAGYEFVVAFKRDTDIDRDIVITEDDIENLKRSKGAIFSAITILLTKVDKSLSEVKKIYIAGGFGNYLDMENAIYIGLLPDIDRKIYEFIGNSSLAGARSALLSREALMKTSQIYKGITYLDLSSEPKYMDEYVAALFFPHTDLGRFPSVR